MENRGSMVMIAFIAAGARHVYNFSSIASGDVLLIWSIFGPYFTEIRMILQIFSRDTMNGDRWL